jgi:hypothetical protein
MIKVRNLLGKGLLTSCILFSASILANPVVMRIGLGSSGPIGPMQQFMSRANAIAGDVSPNGKGSALPLGNTFHGPNSPGGASVAITFDSLENWAEVTENQRTSSQWQGVMQTFPSDSFSINYQGLSEIAWQSAGASPPTAGNVLTIYSFDIMSGGVQPLVAFLERMMAVGQREGIGGQATVMVPIVGGSGSNQTATVVIRFDSANTWADGVAKQNASSAWQSAFATFPVQTYQLTNQAMSTVFAIP